MEALAMDSLATEVLTMDSLATEVLATEDLKMGEKKKIS